MSDKPKLCKACKKAPASQANCGLAGSAMLAGMCYPCWKKKHGKGRRPGPVPGRSMRRAAKTRARANGLAKAMRDLEDLMTSALKAETEAFLSDTKELVARVFARIDEMTRRRLQLRKTMGRIEQQARTAAAELRREVQRLKGARVATRSELSRLPKPLGQARAEADEASEDEEKAS